MPLELDKETGYVKLPTLQDMHKQNYTQDLIEGSRYLYEKPGEVNPLNYEDVKFTGAELQDEKSSDAMYEHAANKQGFTVGLGTFTGRIIGQTFAKFGEGVSMVAGLVPALATWDIDYATDNFAVKAFEKVDNSVKDALPWYKEYTQDYLTKDPISKLGNWTYWLTQGTDGFAFMLSAIAETALTGGLFKLGLSSKIAKGITTADDWFKAARGASKGIEEVQRGLDLASVGSKVNFWGGVGTSTLSESLFEGRGVGQDFIRQRKPELDQTLNYLNESMNKELNNLVPISNGLDTPVKNAEGITIGWKDSGLEDYKRKQEEITKLYTDKINLVTQDFETKKKEAEFGTFITNVPMLLASNGVEMSAWFKSFKGTGKAIEKAAKDNWEVAGRIGKELIKQSATEGSEEVQQLAISNYYTDKALGKEDRGWVKGIVENYFKNYTTTEGIENFIGGAVIGIIPGIGGGLIHESDIKKQERHLDAISTILNINGVDKNSFTNMYEKDAEGNIKYDENNRPVKDESKFIALAKDYVHAVKRGEIQDEAAIKGDYTAWSIAGLKNFAVSAIPFLREEGTTERLEYQIDEMAKAHGDDVEKIKDSDKNGIIQTEAQMAVQYKIYAKEFQKIWDNVTQRQAGVIDQLIKIDKKDYDNKKDYKKDLEEKEKFITSLKHNQYYEGTKQHILKNALNDVNSDIVKIGIEELIKTGEVKLEGIDKQKFDILLKTKENILEELEKSYKNFEILTNRKEQVNSFKQQLETAKEERKSIQETKNKINDEKAKTNNTQEANQWLDENKDKYEHHIIQEPDIVEDLVSKEDYYLINNKKIKPYEKNGEQYLKIPLPNKPNATYEIKLDEETAPIYEKFLVKGNKETTQKVTPGKETRVRVKDANTFEQINEFGDIIGEDLDINDTHHLITKSLTKEEVLKDQAIKKINYQVQAITNVIHDKKDFIENLRKEVSENEEKELNELLELQELFTQDITKYKTQKLASLHNEVNTMFERLIDKYTKIREDLDKTIATIENEISYLEESKKTYDKLVDKIKSIDEDNYNSIKYASAQEELSYIQKNIDDLRFIKDIKTEPYKELIAETKAMRIKIQLKINKLEHQLAEINKQIVSALLDSQSLDENVSIGSRVLNASEIAVLKNKEAALQNELDKLVRDFKEYANKESNLIRDNLEDNMNKFSSILFDIEQQYSTLLDAYRQERIIELTKQYPDKDSQSEEKAVVEVYQSEWTPPHNQNPYSTMSSINDSGEEVPSQLRWNIFTNKYNKDSYKGSKLLVIIPGNNKFDIPFEGDKEFFNNGETLYAVVVNTKGNPIDINNKEIKANKDGKYDVNKMLFTSLVDSEGSWVNGVKDDKIKADYKKDKLALNKKAYNTTKKANIYLTITGVEGGKQQWDAVNKNSNVLGRLWDRIPKHSTQRIIEIVSDKINSANKAGSILLTSKTGAKVQGFSRKLNQGEVSTITTLLHMIAIKVQKNRGSYDGAFRLDITHSDGTVESINMGQYLRDVIYFGIWNDNAMRNIPVNKAIGFHKGYLYYGDINSDERLTDLKQLNRISINDLANVNNLNNHTGLNEFLLKLYHNVNASALQSDSQFLHIESINPTNYITGSKYFDSYTHYLLGIDKNGNPVKDAPLGTNVKSFLNDDIKTSKDLPVVNRHLNYNMKSALNTTAKETAVEKKNNTAESFRTNHKLEDKTILDSQEKIDDAISIFIAIKDSILETSKKITEINSGKLSKEQKEAEVEKEEEKFSNKIGGFKEKFDGTNAIWHSLADSISKVTYNKKAKIVENVIKELESIDEFKKEETPNTTPEETTKEVNTTITKDGTYRVYYILNNRELYIDMKQVNDKIKYANLEDDDNFTNDESTILFELLSGKLESDENLKIDHIDSLDNNNNEPNQINSIETTKTEPIVERDVFKEAGLVKDEKEETSVSDVSEENKSNVPFREESLRTTKELENIEKFKQWAKKNLPESVSVLIEQGLIDGHAMGSFYKDVITLSELAEEGTGYHEAFHKVSLTLSSEAKRKELYAEYNKINNTNLSDTQVEEKLAEGFREYALNNNPKTLLGKFGKKVSDFFNKVLEVINSILGIESDTNKISELYKLINDGGFKDAKSIATYNSTKRYSTLVEGLSQNMTKGILSSINYTFINDLAKDNFINFQQILLNKLPKTFNQDENREVTESYERAFDKVVKNITDEDVVNLVILNKEKLIKISKQSMKYMMVNINTDETLEENKGRDKQYDADSTKIDPSHEIAPAIKFLLHLIPTGKTSVVGLPVFNEFLEVRTTLLKELNGLTNLDEIKERLENIKDTYPFIENIQRVLGLDVDKDTLDKDSFYLQKQFAQSFSITRLKSFTMIHGENGAFFTDSNSENIVNAIVNTWKNNAIENSSKRSESLVVKNNIVKFNKKYFTDIVTKTDKNYKVANAELAQKFFKGLSIDVDVDNLGHNMSDVNKLISYIMTDIILTDRSLDDLYSSLEFGQVQRLKKLAKLQISEEDIAKADAQYRGADGETRYELTQFSNLTMMANVINNYKTLEELVIAHPEYGFLSPTNNKAITQSMLFNTLYKYNRKTGYYDLVDKDFTINLLGGITTETKGVEGKMINKAAPGDLISARIFSVLSKYIPYVRASDKSNEHLLSMPYSVGDFKAETINYKLDDFHNQMFKFYAGELYQFMRNPHTNMFNKVTKEKVKVPVNRVFSDILSSNTILSNFESTITDASKVMETVIAKYESDSNYKEAFNTSMNKFLLEETNRVKQLLISNKLIEDEDSKGNYTNLGISLPVSKNNAGRNFKESFTESELNTILQAYVTNEIVYNFDQTMMITGSLMHYDNFTKRTPAFIGTKDYPQYDDITLHMLNNSFKRKDGKYMDGNVNIMIAPDVDSKITEIGTQNIKQMLLDTYKKEGVSKDLRESIAEAEANMYKKMTETDGIMYITPDYFREWFIALGKWNNTFENSYQHYMKINDIYEKYHNSKDVDKLGLLKELDALKEESIGKIFIPFPSQKPSTGTFAMDANGDNHGTYIPMFNKCSFEVILPHTQYKVIKETNDKGVTTNVTLFKSALGKLHDYMQTNKIDIYGYDSGSKADYFTDEEKSPSIFDIYEGNNKSKTTNGLNKIVGNSVGRQLETNEFQHEEATLGSQNQSLRYSDIYENGIDGGITVNGKKVFLGNELDRLANKLFKLNKEKLLKDLDIVQDGDNYYVNDYNKLINKLKRELTSRDLSLDTIESLKNLIQKIDETTTLNMPLNVLLETDRIEPILLSMISKTIKTKVSGTMAYQVPSTGWEFNKRETAYNNELKFYEVSNSGESTKAMEIITTLPPSLVKIVDKYFKRDLDLFNKHVEENPEMFTITGFRIPTSGMNSIECMRIKRFSDPSLGDQIVLPSAIVAKSGTDYDIDKMTLYFYDWKYNDKTSKVEYSTDEDSPESVQNKLIATQNSITLSPEARSALISPISTDKLEKIAEEINSKVTDYLDESKVSKMRILTPSYMIGVSLKYWSSKALVGMQAIHNTSHQKALKVGLGITKEMNDISRILRSFKIKSKENNNSTIFLDGTLQTSNGDVKLSNSYSLSLLKDTENYKISKTLNEQINGIIDAVKKPFIFDMNINERTIGVSNYLCRRGASPKQVFLFLKQPIIVDYLNRLNANDSQFLANYDVVHENQLKEKDKNAFYNNKVEKRSEIINQITKLYGALINKDGTIEIDSKTIFTNSSLTDMLGKNYLTLKKNQSEQQLQILRDYLRYDEQARLVGELISASSADRKGAGTSFADNIVNQQTYENIKNAKFFTSSTSKLDGVDAYREGNLMETTNIAESTKDIFKGVDIQFNEIMQPYIQPVYDYFKDKKSPKNKVDIFKKASKHLTDYILNLVASKYNSLEEIDGKPNSVYLYKSYDRLFTGDNKISKRVADAKKEIIGNKFLDALFSKINDRSKKGGIVNIGLSNKRMDSQEVDAYKDSVRVLYKKDPQLVKDILFAHLLQSGIKNSPISFLQLFPSEIKMAFSVDVFKSLLLNPDSRILLGDYGNFKVNFLKNNWENGNIIPYVKPSKYNGVKIIGDKLMISSSNYNYEWEIIKTYVRNEDNRSNEKGHYQLWQKISEDDNGAIFEKTNQLGLGDMYTEIKPNNDATNVNSPDRILSEEDVPREEEPTWYPEDMDEMLKEGELLEDYSQKTGEVLGSNKTINIYSSTKNGYENLSNFAEWGFEYPSVVTGENVKFKTIEGAFQAAKLEYTNLSTPDKATIETKLMKASGAQAKSIGGINGSIKGLNREKWDKNSSRIMLELMRESFIQNPKAVELLLSTGNATLTHTQDNTKWKIEFPRLLMEVRSELRKDSQVNSEPIKDVLGDLGITIKYNGDLYIPKNIKTGDWFNKLNNIIQENYPEYKLKKWGFNDNSNFRDTYFIVDKFGNKVSRNDLVFSELTEENKNENNSKLTEKYFVSLQKSTTENILTKIVTEGETEYYRNLATRLLKTGVNIPIELVDQEFLDNAERMGAISNANISGNYDLDFKRILLNKDILSKYNNKYTDRVILHEIMHSVLKEKLLTNKSFRDKIQSLYDEANKTLSYNEKTGINYGMKDLDEFLSEAFSSSVFQSKLAQIKGTMGNTSLLHQFIEHVVNILKYMTGITNAEATLLDDVLFVSENELGTSPILSEDKMNSLGEDVTVQQFMKTLDKTDRETLRQMIVNKEIVFKCN